MVFQFLVEILNLSNWLIAKHNKLFYNLCTLFSCCTVPVEHSDHTNRTLVVGTIMGQIGVVTWEGYDTYPKDGNEEGMNYNFN